MKITICRVTAASLLAVLTGLFVLSPAPSPAQFYTYALSPEEALRGLRSEVGWFRSATRTAPNFVQDGAGALWQRFQMLRSSFDRFRAALSPSQQAPGANELAELSSGLDIIQEAFGDPSLSAGNGPANPLAFRRMCGVVDRAVVLWASELERVSRRLGVQ